LLTVANPTLVPVSLMVLVLVVGGFFLPVRALFLLYVLVAVGLTYVAVRRSSSSPLNRSVVILLLTTALLMLWVAHSRERLGVQGTAGESMLVDLRDRLRAQGEMPELPSGWAAEVVMRSAFGDSFSGDFLIATRSTDRRRLELALVDVSGKGAGAGTRALLLSGALGGLLGAMAAADFLPAANEYLLRQRWTEGFATAVHLALDLETGAFSIGSAGHPPAAQFHSGSGRWTVITGGAGPLLGVIEAVDFPIARGSLQRGDALLLYTDGVVETRRRDLSVGIDRMLGQAEVLVTKGFRGGAKRIVDSALAGESDDRACVLLWRV
jgi:Stage II sporulation protein E (SpoIIE)